MFLYRANYSSLILLSFTVYSSLNLLLGLLRHFCNSNKCSCVFRQLERLLSSFQLFRKITFYSSISSPSENRFSFKNKVWPTIMNVSWFIKVNKNTLGHSSNLIQGKLLVFFWIPTNLFTCQTQFANSSTKNKSCFNSDAFILCHLKLCSCQCNFISLLCIPLSRIKEYSDDRMKSIKKFYLEISKIIHPVLFELKTSSFFGVEFLWKIKSSALFLGDKL